MAAENKPEGLKRIRNPDRMYRSAVSYAGHAAAKGVSDDTEANTIRCYYSRVLHVGGTRQKGKFDLRGGGVFISGGNTRPGNRASAVAKPGRRFLPRAPRAAVLHETRRLRPTPSPLRSF
ncbi:hypothetical protein COCON_G00177450 [Conger conger]|uniref:Uncharacterized protein n=1 Tax=Conger conger TaxID=82655 RepID=A0A9Q1HSM4_CONCO|nr:hypothetical protein COCON_G00177450 [Conger conger]